MTPMKPTHNFRSNLDTTVVEDRRCHDTSSVYDNLGIGDTGLGDNRGTETVNTFTRNHSQTEISNLTWEALRGVTSLVTGSQDITSINNLLKREESKETRLTDNKSATCRT